MGHANHRRAKSSGLSFAIAVSWLPVIMALAYGGYFVFRYGGLWAENDTAAFSEVTTQMLAAKSVLFSGQYPHGFGYPAWLGSLSLLTGLNVPLLNTVVMPYFGALLLAVPAFLAFRVLLRSDKVAVLAVFLLMAVPELMFSALRGNHEKLNIAFMMGAVYLLFKGVEAGRQAHVGKIAAFVVLFYVMIFFNDTANDFFGSTFSVASTLTLLVCVMFLRRRDGASPQIRSAVLRMTLTVAISWLMVWWVMLFVFPVAGHDFHLLTTVVEKLVGLFLSVRAAHNPFSTTRQAWAGGAIYTVMASFRWVLFLGSLGFWLSKMYAGLVRRVPLELPPMFLLAMYGAMGFLVFVSIPVDFLGLNAGTNLEVRNFTYFALFAAPLFAWGIAEKLGTHAMEPMDQTGERRRRRSFRLNRRMVKTGLGVGLALLMALGALKTTLDPIVSNQWIFYTRPELEAIRAFWHLSRHQAMWTGPDNRLANVTANWLPFDPHGNAVVGFQVPIMARDFLQSPVVQANAIAQKTPLPPVGGQDRIYDNGGAQIYRLKPTTPFQN